ncbi:hypothetical protein BKA80DRAFT_260811 [Phyllosticta citrichinensis]
MTASRPSFARQSASGQGFHDQALVTPTPYLTDSCFQGTVGPCISKYSRVHQGIQSSQNSRRGHRACLPHGQSSANKAVVIGLLVGQRVHKNVPTFSFVSFHGHGMDASLRVGRSRAAWSSAVTDKSRTKSSIPRKDQRPSTTKHQATDGLAAGMLKAWTEPQITASQWSKRGCSGREIFPAP